LHLIGRVNGIMMLSLRSLPTQQFARDILRWRFSSAATTHQTKANACIQDQSQPAAVPEHLGGESSCEFECSSQWPGPVTEDRAQINAI
jgi:hypothetical protein